MNFLKQTLVFINIFFILILLMPDFALAQKASQGPLRIDVTIRHHRFETTVTTVPKGQPLLFRVTNAGKSMEEFESYDMAFEVVVRPGQTVEIPVSGLGEGTYEYFGDFHPGTARGTITVK